MFAVRQTWIMHTHTHTPASHSSMAWNRWYSVRHRRCYGSRTFAPSLCSSTAVPRYRSVGPQIGDRRVFSRAFLGAPRPRRPNEFARIYGYSWHRMLVLFYPSSVCKWAALTAFSTFLGGEPFGTAEFQPKRLMLWCLSGRVKRKKTPLLLSFSAHSSHCSPLTYLFGCIFAGVRNSSY